MLIPITTGFFTISNMPIETNESKKKLTFNQEAFCKLYVSKEYFGN